MPGKIYYQSSNTMHNTSLTISTIFGHLSITQPILIELINHPIMQRLKKIHQHGITAYAVNDKRYTRYDHSIGVLYLLNYFDASLKEQIAGLLHDASHTVFSHVGDFIFGNNCQKNSYQDNIHQWFLEKMKLENILHKYNLNMHEILHKNGSHTMLEQDLPNICVDRLEYNLHGTFLSHLISKKNINTILAHLKFENGIWFFTNQEPALMLGLLSLNQTERNWGAAWNGVLYHLAAQAVKRAVEIKLITEDEIHFGTDDTIFNKLNNSSDTQISENMQKIINFQDTFQLSDAHNYDLHLKPKFRGINPWVQTTSGLNRLTEINTAFACEYQRVQSIIKNGWYVKFN